MPYSAGLRVGVGGSTVIGWLAGVETKAAKWPDYCDVDRTTARRFEQRFPGALSLYAALRYPFMLCSLSMCKIGYGLGVLSSISRQAIEPIIVKQGGRFRRLCPCPNLQPQQAPSP
jgi:hypothetical protein